MNDQPVSVEAVDRFIDAFWGQPQGPRTRELVERSLRAALNYDAQDALNQSVPRDDGIPISKPDTEEGKLIADEPTVRKLLDMPAESSGNSEQGEYATNADAEREGKWPEGMVIERQERDDPIRPYRYIVLDGTQATDLSPDACAIYVPLARLEAVEAEKAWVAARLAYKVAAAEQQRDTLIGRLREITTKSINVTTWHKTNEGLDQLRDLAHRALKDIGEWE